MADVIFRGVKNPENCSECFFWSICPCLADFDDYSSILDAVSDGDLVRHEGCPIYPLPEGHGRLIDADAVCKDIVLYRDVETCEAERGNNTQHLERAYGANETLCIVCDAPTIIPAEGGGGE